MSSVPGPRTIAVAEAIDKVLTVAQVSVGAAYVPVEDRIEEMLDHALHLEARIGAREWTQAEIAELMHTMAIYLADAIAVDLADARGAHLRVV